MWNQRISSFQITTSGSVRRKTSSAHRKLAPSVQKGWLHWPRCFFFAFFLIAAGTGILSLVILIAAGTGILSLVILWTATNAEAIITAGLSDHLGKFG